MIVLLGTIEPEPVTWLWDPWIPSGELSICDGPPGAGKSTMLVHLAACITTGRSLPGHREGGEPASVLWLTFEESAPRTLRPRFEAARGDVMRVHVHNPKSDQLCFLGQGSQLESIIRRHRVALVIIDPLFGAVPGRVDMNKSQQARQILSPVSRTAQATGAAIVAVRHFNKNAGERSALNRGEGSLGGIGGVARRVLAVGKEPGGTGCSIVAASKGNLRAPQGSLRFAICSWSEDPEIGVAEWRGESKLTADDLTGSDGHESGGAVDLAAEFLREELADGPRPTKDIMAAAEGEHSTTAIKRARARLGVRSKKTGAGWVLALPDDPNSGGGDDPAAA